MELITKTGIVKIAGDGVDSIGGEQEGAVGLLRNEIPERPAQRPGHPYPLALAMDEGKVASNFPDCCG